MDKIYCSRVVHHNFSPGTCKVNKTTKIKLSEIYWMKIDFPPLNVKQLNQSLKTISCSGLLYLFSLIWPWQLNGKSLKANFEFVPSMNISEILYWPQLEGRLWDGCSSRSNPAGLFLCFDRCVGTSPDETLMWLYQTGESINAYAFVDNF